MESKLERQKINFNPVIRPIDDDLTQFVITTESGENLDVSAQVLESGELKVNINGVEKTLPMSPFEQGGLLKVNTQTDELTLKLFWNYYNLQGRSLAVVDVSNEQSNSPIAA